MPKKKQADANEGKEKQARGSKKPSRGRGIPEAHQKAQKAVEPRLRECEECGAIGLTPPRETGRGGRGEKSVESEHNREAHTRGGE